MVYLFIEPQRHKGHKGRWLIKASLNQISQEDAQYIIELHPAYGHEEWVIGTKSVKLYGQDLNPKTFTSVWKFFEEKLNQITGKADLVQLSGYYQYSPKISGVITFHPKAELNNLWRVIQYVISGVGISAQFTAIELAEKWCVEAENIFSYLQSLRIMGYEVRNHNTNSQIPKGKYLIPYTFPTLNPKSVQLRRDLAPIDEPCYQWLLGLNNILQES